MSKDMMAITEVGAVSDLREPHTISHYLYVPNRGDARTIAEELKRRGFHTEERLGADSVNWLVLARHEAIPTEERMASVRRSMEILIAKVGGEYDGWEADVRHHDGSAR